MCDCNQKNVFGVPKVSTPGTKMCNIALSTRTILRLHYMKLTRGKTTSSIVEEALTDYFRKLGIIEE